VTQGTAARPLVRFVAGLLVVAVAGCGHARARGSFDAEGSDVAPSTVVGAASDTAASASATGATDGAADSDPTSSATTISDAAASTVTTVDLGALTRTIGPGDQGPEVLALQTRLNELHFDVKKPDGYWGPNTSMAVWAYKQLVLGVARQDVNARVTPEVWEKMRAQGDLPARRPDATPTHIEIFLEAQALVVYEQGALRLITHISTGSGEHWCALPRNVPAWTGATTTVPPGGRMQRVCGDAVTPGGTFKVYRKEQGWYDIPLGKVYNPMYFNGGLAIHGYQDVPFKPASHGCVRLPMHIADYLPDIVHTGDEVFVWDGVEEPETYGAQRPPLDQPDPTDPGGGRAPSKPPPSPPSTPASTAAKAPKPAVVTTQAAAATPTKPPTPTVKS
jgi:peptidoglycan hydrolase-like protein with peptidoglycan-binding domain